MSSLSKKLLIYNDIKKNFKNEPTNNNKKNINRKITVTISATTTNIDLNKFKKMRVDSSKKY